MKRLLLVLALLLAGCRRTTDLHCQKDWQFLTAGIPAEYYQDGMEMIQTLAWPKDSVGAYLQQCVKEGWKP